MKKALFSLLGLSILALPACSPEPEGAFFTVDGQSYQYEEAQASVLDGAYTGLELNFIETKGSSASSLSFELPSTVNFLVRDVYPSFEYEIGTLPFVLTEEDLTGPYSDRIEAWVLPHLYWKLNSDSGESKVSVEFSDFEIELEEFEIDEENRLTFRAKFTGKTLPSEILNTEAQAIEGHFYLSKVELSLTEIE